mgnify:CR=1 FL=1
MKIVTLNVKNFMSIGDISINLDRPGLNLVLGKNLDDKRFDSNGSAKSALFEAMAWGLYGKFLREIPIDDVVRIGEKELSVQVTIDPEDGTGLITLLRVRKNKTTEVSVVNSYNTPLFPSDSVKDIQKYIDNWLGVDFRTFTNSVYFGKGLTKFFMSSSDTERKELLDTVLQMVSFDKALDISKNSLKTLEDTVNNNKIEITVASSLLEEKKRLLGIEEEALVLIESSYNKLPIYTAEYRSLTDIIESKKLQKEALKSDIYSLDEYRQRSIDGIHKDFINKTRDINSSSPLKISLVEEAFKKETTSISLEKEAALESITSSILTIEKSISSLNKEKIELQKILHTYESEKASLKNKYTKFSAVNTGAPCLHCMQLVNKEHKQHILDQYQKDIDILIGYIEEGTVKEAAYTSNIDSLSLNKQELLISKKEIENSFLKKSSDLSIVRSKKIAEINKEIADQLSKIEEEYHNKVIPIQTEISTKKRVLDETLSKLDSEIMSLGLQAELQKKFMATIESDYNRQKKSIDTIKNQIESLSNKIKEIEDTNTSLDKDITRVQFWVDAFGSQGIKSFVFENALPYITERANFYSTSLTGGTVVIDISPITKYKTKAGFQEKLNVSAINKNGSNVYPGNSDGERRRIDICILLALQDLISTRASKVWNTVVFDEIFDALDKTGIEHVIDLFRTFENKSIFIISHSEDIKKYFDTAVVIEKKKGISSLREL